MVVTDSMVVGFIFYWSLWGLCRLFLHVFPLQVGRDGLASNSEMLASLSPKCWEKVWPWLSFYYCWVRSDLLYGARYEARWDKYSITEPSPSCHTFFWGCLLPLILEHQKLLKISSEADVLVLFCGFICPYVFSLRNAFESIPSANPSPNDSHAAHVSLLRLVHLMLLFLLGKQVFVRLHNS